MSDIKCASCSANLTSPELHEGWCNSCGKQVPMFVYHLAGLKGPKGTALPRVLAAPAPSMLMDPEERPPVWQLALLGVAVLGIAAAIVLAFI